jgi:hypothetical protein
MTIYSAQYLALQERMRKVTALAKQGRLLKCVSGPGLYEHLGMAKGAGAMRDQMMEFYRSIDTGQLYYRTPLDFKERMQFLPFTAQEATMNVVTQITTDNMSAYNAVEIQGLDAGGWITREADKQVKFGVFAHLAQDGGVDLIATADRHEEAHDYAVELGAECDWPVQDHSGQ